LLKLKEYGFWATYKEQRSFWEIECRKRDDTRHQLLSLTREGGHPGLAAAMHNRQTIDELERWKRIVVKCREARASYIKNEQARYEFVGDYLLTAGWVPRRSGWGLLEELP